MGSMSTRFLVDTHTLLWWYFNDPKLSQAARSAIRNDEHDIYVSSVTAWEIATKFRKGKLSKAKSVVDNYARLMVESAFDALFVTTEHALLAGSIVARHRDPFDRMLAAQSIIEGIPVITKDPAIETLGAAVVW